MKLIDLDRKNMANSALKETFEFSFNTTKLDRKATQTMLSKVNNLIKEARDQKDFYTKQTSPSYLKLVFMQQALNEHLSSIKAPRIVVENEEVQKSEVILAAQDMLDSIQKMIEEVNDMLVKELPALTDSIQSQIGVNESTSFNGAASEALTTLNQALSQSKTSMQNAMNQLTGVGDPSMLGAPATGGGEMPVTDIGAGQAPAGDMAMAPDMPADMPPVEEPEDKPEGSVGRSKR